MSRRERITQAEEGLAEIQEVLDRAQTALEVAGRIDDAATQTIRKSRTLLKLVVVLGVVGVVVLVVRRVMSSADPEADTYADSGGGGSD